MIDFVNPGLFESYGTFKRVFEDPILRSRQPGCSTSEAKLGLERSQELTRLTAQFILRRTAQVNYEFLPRKTEFIVFCRPSPLQQTLYRRMVGSTYLQNCFTMDGTRHLACITALRKLCNSSKLVLAQAEVIVANDRLIFTFDSNCSMVAITYRLLRRRMTKRRKGFTVISSH